METSSSNCPKCGSSEVHKLVSRPAKFRTEDGRVDEIADRLESMSDADDSLAMRDLVRELGHAMDDDMADEMEELYEADMEGTAEPVD